MARRLANATGWAVGGYVMAALGGGLLVAAISTNHFDRQMEIVMTGAFVTGPLGAVLAFITGYGHSRRRRRRGRGKAALASPPDGGSRSTIVTVGRGASVARSRSPRPN